MSLDGYIARPDGAVDFLVKNKDTSRLKAEFFATVDTAGYGPHGHPVTRVLIRQRCSEPTQPLTRYSFRLFQPMIAGMRVLAAALLPLFLIKSSLGCSVLSHEAVIDALWDVKLKSVLLSRFPNATETELKRAHGYAYGGAIIQDLGYYPHGNKTFSDLTHYVRTGDFVLALISESQNLDELAFALGAMSHYVSDIEVHRFATNLGVPLLYPKLGRKYRTCDDVRRRSCGTSEDRIWI